MFLATIHLALHTFRECLRQPIFLAVLLFSLFLLGLQPVLSLFVFSEHIKLVTDGSLAVILVFGWITAVLCSGYSISKEIESGTVLLILSKPVSSFMFITSKTIGLLAVLSLYVWICGIATLLAVKMAGADQFNVDRSTFCLYYGTICSSCVIGGATNYFTKKSFSEVSTVTLGVFFSLLLIHYLVGIKLLNSITDKHHALQLIRAIILILFAIYIMVSFSSVFSIHFNLLTNMMLCGIVFGTGLISDYLYLNIMKLELFQITNLLMSWPTFFICIVCFLGILTSKIRRKNDQKFQIISARIYSVLGIVFFCSAALIFMDKIQSKGQLNVVMEIFALFLFNHKEIMVEIIHSVVPNWHLFWMADALSTEKLIPNLYVIYGFIYFVLYGGFLLLLSLILFNQREFGKQRII